MSKINDLIKEVWDWADKWYEYSFTEQNCNDAVELKKILNKYK